MMFVLVLFIQLAQPGLPPNEAQVSYEAIARYASEDECMKAKADIIKNNKETGKHAYECLELSK
jgi:hypothetical protein